MEYNDKSDNDLMEKFSECSFKAYDEIVKRYKKRLFNFLLMGLIQDSDVAQDILQETFIRVYNNKFTYQPTFRFSTWIYTICRNLALNSIRGVKPSNLDLIISGKNPKVVPGGVEEDFDREELYEALREIIKGLDLKYRDIVTMRFFEELSYEEIAEITSININTLKSHCKRGLEKIGIELEEKGFGKI